MVEPHTMAVFAGASIALIAAPGPAVSFIVMTTVRTTRSAGLAAAAGVNGGNLVHALAAALGISALLAASATAFTVVKVAGALWLLWLAVRAWRARTPGTVAQLVEAGPPPDPGRRGLLRHYRAGLVVGLLNPKTALFFLAFLPQFVHPGSGSATGQLLVLGLTFVALALVGDSLWALGGDVLRRLIPRVRMIVLDRISAGVFAALGTLTLAARRVA